MTDRINDSLHLWWHKCCCYCCAVTGMQARRNGEGIDPDSFGGCPSWRYSAARRQSEMFARGTESSCWHCSVSSATEIFNISQFGFLYSWDESVKSSIGWINTKNAMKPMSAMDFWTANIIFSRTHLSTMWLARKMITGPDTNLQQKWNTNNCIPTRISSKFQRYWTKNVPISTISKTNYHSEAKMKKSR